MNLIGNKIKREVVSGARRSHSRRPLSSEHWLNSKKLCWFVIVNCQVWDYVKDYFQHAIIVRNTILCSRINSISDSDPAADACSTCASYRLKVCDPDMTDDEQRTETATFSLRRRRTRVFYEWLGVEEQDSLAVCFDVVQNLVLPKTAIGQAYYSRQLYMYLFGVVVHHGKRQSPSEARHPSVWLAEQEGQQHDRISSWQLLPSATQRDCSRKQETRNVQWFVLWTEHEHEHSFDVHGSMKQLPKPSFPIKGHCFLQAVGKTTRKWTVPEFFPIHRFHWRHIRVASPTRPWFRSSNLFTPCSSA